MPFAGLVFFKDQRLDFHHFSSIVLGHSDSSPVLVSFASGGNNDISDVRLAAHVTQSRHGKVTHHCSMA